MNVANQKLSVFSKFSYLWLPLVAIICVFPFISSMQALVLGLILALSLANPYQKFMKKITRIFLSLSIIGLGAGMDLSVVAKVGLEGIWYTVISISLTFLFGMLLGKLFNIENDIGLLICTGTAICGGSAIAAVAPVIGAKERDMSLALIIVFLLNAVALIIFPSIGHFFHLSEAQFGFFSALAIHDTSSVVGASLEYGPKALEVGTTIKLARALWIIPVAALIGLIKSRSQSEAKNGPIRRPWFIVGFIFAAALVTFFPELAPIGAIVETGARRLMVVTLFLIGASLNREGLKGVGVKPFFQALVLWLIVSSLTLLAISLGWIA
ncbi:MAG: putative sulfate exporter family transporter [Myxococcales bacterium]|nr:putative sulfate exporter family transporter [Myxococcales bacterium]USN51534.1 MAG: putative sulfate exporter family transporter [Myxococcales bacterium]